MTARLPRILRRRRNLAIGALVVVIAAGSSAAWAATRGSDSTSGTTTTTETVSSGTVSQTISTTGTIEPATEADLSFPVSGTVTSVKVSVGDKVKKGQVLATVGKSSLKLAVTVAKSSLTAAKEQLSSAETGSSSSQVAAAKASVASAKANVATARDNLASGNLKSTVTGTVATVNISKGDTVGSSNGSNGSSGSGGNGSNSDSSSGSSADVVVISTSSWIVNASVGSSDLASVKKGLQARITPTDATATAFGTVSSVGIVASSSSSSSSSSATFPVVIAITGNPKGLYAGGSASVSIVIKQVSGIISVATSAIHSSGGSTYVLKLVGGKQVKTNVTIGQVYGPTTQITKGLAAGDKVVVTRVTRTGGGTGNGTGNGNRGGFGGGGFGGGGFGGGGFGGGGGNFQGGGPAGGGNQGAGG